MKYDINIDYSGEGFLVENDFIRMGELGTLLKNGLPRMRELEFSGCYAITKPKKYIVDFIEPNEARKKKNVVSPWDVNRLKDKWNETAEVVYFGIAGIKSNRSLRKRLNDLINHGNGKTTLKGPHKGGEIFWQLKDYEKFELWILPMEKPRGIEEEYLKIFFQQIGKLPFANRQF